MGLINLSTQATRISSSVRNNLTGNTGLRHITTSLTGSSSSGGNWLVDLFKALGGGIVNIGKILFAGLSFSFTAIWSWVVAATQYVWNFNWNITDTQLAQQYQAFAVQLSGQLGSTLGNAMGFLACGYLPTAGIMVFNEALAVHVLEKVTEEFIDELSGNLVALTNTLFRIAVSSLFVETFKASRKMVKEWFRDPTSTTSKVANALIPNFTERVKTWGEPGSKPWSFASATDAYINSLSDPIAEEFLQEFLDEFGDGCVEAGYVVAGGIDSYLAERRLTQEALQGRSNQLITLTPNRRQPEETILLAGSESEIRNQAITALSAYSLVENRDVGQIVGEIHREAVVRVPTSGITLKLIWRDSDHPPYKTRKIVRYNIPGIMRNKIDNWSEIKGLMGGNHGYLWGRFWARARLRSRSMLHVYGGSEEIAVDMLKGLLTLSTDVLLSLSVGEEKKEGERRIHPSLYKQTTKMYPSQMVIINREKVLLEDEGRSNLSGIYNERKYVIPMYTNSPPDNFQQILTDLFSKAP
jgi:hypothetical protein